MIEAIVLLSIEVGVILVIRSGAWRRLLRLASEGRVSTRRVKGVGASLIRTSGHLWLLLGFVPMAVLVATFVSVERLEKPMADLLAVSALGLTVWCAWKAVQCYRWAWRVSKIDAGGD
jgi:hypothetical protein